MNSATPAVSPARSDVQPTIIVVGMGPVGMTAALGLARRGHQVTVLEAGPDLATESRASTFHPSSLELLDELGVAEELIEIGLVAPAMQYRASGGEVIAHLDMGALSGEARFPFRVQAEQSKLTRIIRPHLEADPLVTLRFGAPVERVEVGTDCALVFLPGDGLEPSYRADWLIAADGANSAVRRSLGIAFEGVTYPERFLVASTTHDFRDDFEGLADVNYVYDPEDWGVLLRTPDHWRALFSIQDSEPDAEAVDPARIQQRLQGVAAIDGPYPVLHSTLYKVHQRLARVFALGRVLLAGDAAHINNPLGGMGMNSGLHDADAAVTAVHHALTGGDPVRAAETYAKVRRDAAALDVQSNTQKNYDEMREQDAATRERTKADMAAIEADPVRLRRHLRRTSMLDSLRLSRRRMAHGLATTASHPAVPAGTRLADMLRGEPLAPGRTRRVPATLLPTDLVAVHDLVTGDDRPLVVSLGEGDDAVARVRALELAGAAAVLLPPSASQADVADAVAARRDILVIASLRPTAGDATARAAQLSEAGADLIHLPGWDAEVADGVLRAAPTVPLALDEADGLPSGDVLHLAGVALVLAPQAEA